jgi:hypothetical protein
MRGLVPSVANGPTLGLPLRWRLGRTVMPNRGGRFAQNDLSDAGHALHRAPDIGLPTSRTRGDEALQHAGLRSPDRSRLAALMRALGRGKPEIHHSDQGVQYAATAYLFQKTRAFRSTIGPLAQITLQCAGRELYHGALPAVKKTTIFKVISVQNMLSQTMVIEKPQEVMERPRDVTGSRFSIIILECDFSNQGLKDGFREGKTRRNRGSEPSSLFFSPCRVEE